MEGRVNYLVTGIFVALFISGIFGFAFWLMKYSQYEKMDRYVVYFDESVAGLNKDASVKYMGVDAGIVEDIRVHPGNTLLVDVYLKIKHDIKITEDMRATLKFYGMTGLAYVEISGSDPHAPLLQAPDGQIPVIKSAPSIFAKLDEILARSANQFSAAMQKVDTLLSEENMRHFASTLDNIDHVTAALSDHRTDITALIHKSTQLEAKATQTLQKVDTLIAGFGPDAGRESLATLREVRRLMRHIDTTLKRGDYNLKALTAPVADRLTTLIDRLTDLSDEMDQTIEQIRQSPGDLLFKRSSPVPGPGE